MNFDMAACTFCKMCADFCPKNAIDFTTEYSLISVSGDRSNLIEEGTFVKKLPPKPVPKPVGAASNAQKTAGTSPASNIGNALK